MALRKLDANIDFASPDGVAGTAEPDAEADDVGAAAVLVCLTDVDMADARYEISMTIPYGKTLRPYGREGIFDLRYGRSLR
jgi:hypothetical protein